MNNNKIKRNSNNSVYILYKEVMVPIGRVGNSDSHQPIMITTARESASRLNKIIGINKWGEACIFNFKQD